MGHATTVSFACLSCGMGFRKDLNLFGNADEFCPHCENKFVINAVTNESVLFEFGGMECDRMLEVACDKNRAIKTTSVLKDFGFIRDDEESVHTEDPDLRGRREEAEQRKMKLLKMKEKRKTQMANKQKKKAEVAAAKMDGDAAIT